MQTQQVHGVRVDDDAILEDEDMEESEEAPRPDQRLSKVARPQAVGGTKMLEASHDRYTPSPQTLDLSSISMQCIVLADCLSGSPNLDLIHPGVFKCI
jgi:hypothetical protein